MPTNQDSVAMSMVWLAILNTNNTLNPSFNIEEDNIAYQYVKNAFPDCHIHLLEMTEIAKEGGALHCISWNIQR